MTLRVTTTDADMRRLAERCREFSSFLDWAAAKITAVQDVDSVDQLVTLAEIERRYVAQVWIATGNKVRAARVLGISVRQLYRLLRAQGIATDTGGANVGPALAARAAKHVARKQRVA